MGTSWLLYSTNTWLAYNIASRFYSEFYVSCAPYFTDGRPPHERVDAGSPAILYSQFEDAARTGDRNNAYIEKNKVGIIRGASAMRQKDRITAAQEQEIGQMVAAAEARDFRPLLLLIRYPEVKRRKLIMSAPVDLRSNVLSEDYIIPALPKPLFEVIYWRNIL